MPLLFAATLFLSASLLFMVQPMVGKMVLPLLGGSPAVWNGCMVFFQALLLLGYLYAHWVTTKFEPKKQWRIHLGVLTLPVAAMALCVAFGARHTPIAIAESLAPSDDSSPILSVLALMSVAIGLPFLVASTSAPLLQKWFAYTGHPSARDPYFLYAASNAGSLISLLGYPIFIEPNLTLGQQAWLFAGIFVILIGLIFVCGRAAANPIGVPPSAMKQQATAKATDDPPPSFARKLKWVALAFVPSSLMLGVTTHMTTDIASIPLLWVIPLALYLVTFIIAFARLPDWFRLVIGNLAPVMILLLVFLMISGVSPGVGITLLLHNLTFFFAALMCHYELARDRPSTKYLTVFFLLMSVGGVLGGLFNSIVAPLLLSQTIYDYSIALVIACLLVPKLGEDLEDTTDDTKAVDRHVDVAMGLTTNPFVYFVRRIMRKVDRDRNLGLVLDIVIPVLVGLLFFQLTRMPSHSEWFVRATSWISMHLALSLETVRVVFIYAVPVMVCFFFVDRPLRFALCVAAILGYGIHQAEKDRDGVVVYTERGFFGVLKVQEGGVFMRLVHGTTLHGTQIKSYYLHRMDSPVVFGAFHPYDVLLLEGTFASWDPRQEPLTYYHRTGPVGAAFRELRSRKNGADAKSHVAMVGLGTGSASCYALPGQKLTFYEIDPAVKRLVADPTLFELMDQKASGNTEFKAALAHIRPVVTNSKYFTYVGDARRRGAELDFRMGDARLKLKEDADRRYSLLMVDAFSSDSIPVHLLTNESVKLYTERMTDDGILMLHISNKFVSLEPVVAAIAKENNLVARVWNDNADKRPGKTASSWVALAKDVKTLGTLGLPDEAQREFETNFRELEVKPDVPAWTDDYSDVLRVMMIPELQKFRGFLNLPTPVK